jgi:hypothetical protein
MGDHSHLPPYIQQQVLAFGRAPSGLGLSHIMIVESPTLIDQSTTAQCFSAVVWPSRPGWPPLRAAVRSPQPNSRDKIARSRLPLTVRASEGEAAEQGSGSVFSAPRDATLIIATELRGCAGRNEKVNAAPFSSDLSPFRQPELL